MLYLVWYDADARRTIDEKIQDARGAYIRRFNRSPNLILVNAADAIELHDIEVRSERTVQPHHFWVGCSDVANSQEGERSNG